MQLGRLQRMHRRSMGGPLSARDVLPPASPKVRILHLYKDYAPVLGGIEGHLRLLAEGQARRGHDVTVLVTSPAGRSSDRLEGGVRVLRRRRWATLASTPLSPALWQERRRIEADVVHLHAPYPFGELADLLAPPTPCRVVTYHSDIVRQRLLGLLYRPLLHRLLLATDRILVTSPPYLESSAVLRRHRDRCRVVPLGIDIERFARAEADRPPSLEPGRPMVLFVGRLRYYKGLSVLFEALAGVDAELVVAGSGGAARETERRAMAARAASRIHFLGDVETERLPALYAAADLCVLPSTRRSEAFGLVLVEAMAAGKPVVSTELGTGTSWINRHGETGLVVPAGDVEALAAALRRLLGDAELRLRMGANGRRLARERFHVDVMVERTLALYREALDKPPSTASRDSRRSSSD